jgi:hypothetical protein
MIPHVIACRALLNLGKLKFLHILNSYIITKAARPGRFHAHLTGFTPVLQEWMACRRAVIAKDLIMVHNLT